MVEFELRLQGSGLRASNWSLFFVASRAPSLWFFGLGFGSKVKGWLLSCLGFRV